VNTRITVGPFTKTELLEAMAAVMPVEVVQLYRAELSEVLEEEARMSITDPMLLILAALSEGGAERLLEARPDLRDQVADVRADPAAYLARMRAEFNGQE